RMIKLDIIDNQRSGLVVDELGALVEKRGIVFIRLDDKISRITGAGRNTEIFGDPAYQESGVFAGAIQYPGEHTGTTGFAMRTRYGDHMFARQHLLSQPLRA